MNLEQLVTSKELSKKLYKLGVKQESIFYINEKSEIIPEDEYLNFLERAEGIGVGKIAGFEVEKYYSAFTAGELGEMLPISCFTNKFDVGIKWQCHLEELDLTNSLNPSLKIKYSVAANTEADARALMLIHLIENNLMEVK